MRHTHFAMRGLLVTFLAIIAGVPAWAQLGRGGGLSGGSNASVLTTGTLDDARLSANVPLLDQENLFSVPQFINLGTPQLWLNENDEPADGRAWYLGASGGGLQLGTSNDAATMLDYALSAVRSGVTVTTAALHASTQLTLDAPGTVVTGNVTVTGVNSSPLELWGLSSGAAATSYVTVSDSAGTDLAWIGDASGGAALAVLGDLQSGAVGLQAGGSLVQLNSVGNLYYDSVLLTPSEGSFTANFTNACTTTPTPTAIYQRIGNLVNLTVVGFTCTSDSTNLVLDAGDIPAAIRPSTTRCLTAIGATDSGANGVAAVGVLADGSMNFVFNPTGGPNTCGGSGTWTNSGQKAIQGFSVSYTLQ